jgi:uncharacterized protein with gpF-like domain
MYVAVMDSRTRTQHRVLHGRVFRYDDPFYGAFYPPNGYRCRCRVRTLSADRVGSGPGQTPLSSSAGRLDQVEVALSKTNPDAGTTQVARYMLTSPGYPRQLRQYVQVDPGWSHSPGSTWTPVLERYDADLVEQYRKGNTK